jgi:methyltransferase
MILSWTQIFFIVIVLLTGAERLFELRVSNRHASIAFRNGGIEFGRGHFPSMVALHTSLLVGAVVEVVLLDRPFLGFFSWVMLTITALSQVARYWVIWALSAQWNTRVIVIPGASRVRRGPYRFDWLRHPNYWVVGIEGLALPLIHAAWITALSFTILNAILLLGFRIPTENRALATLK